MDRIIQNIQFRRQRSTLTGPAKKEYVVIGFAHETTENTCHDVEKIVKTTPGLYTQLLYTKKSEKFLIITSTTDNLLGFVEKAELKKETNNHTMQKFIKANLLEFLPGEKTSDDIVRACEALTLINEQIKSDLEDYIRRGIITDIFPLHNIEKLKSLSNNLGYIRVEKLRNYYGTSIGLYFAFTLFYAKALIFPLVFGLLNNYLNFNASTVCCFFVVWPTVFLELWKRKCSGLSYRWGNIEMSSFDSPRDEFKGSLEPDPITGIKTKQFPIRITYIRMYLVSYPIVTLCVCIAGYFFWYLTECEMKFYSDYPPDASLFVSYIPALVQSVLIFLFSRGYDELATFLTDYENHRTQSQHDRHRIIKLILFEIVNNFFSPLYIAFYLQDFKQLRYQLMFQFLVFQLISVAIEIGFPLMAVLKGKFKKFNKLDSSDSHNVELFEQCFYESALSKYTSTYEDYLHMWIQFGYIVLFAAVSPFTALWALLFNIAEMKIDTWKLSHIYKRPFEHRLKNIGAWQAGFELLSVIAILTNCGLLYLMPDANMSFLDYFPLADLGMKIIILEHVMLGLKFLLHKVIHEQPRWVRIGILKSDYESSEAYRKIKSEKVKLN